MGNREDLLAGALACLKTKGWTRTTVRDIAAAAGPREQYEAFWRQVIESYAANRWLWLATIEAAVQAEHSPKVRELMAASLRQGRSGLAAGLLGVAEDTLDGPAERALGSVQLALMSGLLMQWLIDPGHAPAERDIADGLLGLAGLLGGAPLPGNPPPG